MCIRDSRSLHHRVFFHPFPGFRSQENIIRADAFCERNGTEFLLSGGLLVFLFHIVQHAQVPAVAVKWILRIDAGEKTDEIRIVLIDEALKMRQFMACLLYTSRCV